MTAPSFGLEGKVALVTGASKGLGRAMALGFAEAGADVIVSSRDLDACESVTTEIRAMGRRSLAVACHVGDWDQCAALVSAAVAEFGRIDILVNNAGIAPVPPSIPAITEELFDKTIAVNLKGPVRLTGLVADHMPAGGSIINISSKASERPSPFTIVYAAAKAGLNAVTKATAQEYGPRGIRANAIVCGPFLTDSFEKALPTPEAAAHVAGQSSVGYLAGPEEIVGTALFLASDASKYMTGALLALDGGGS
jgi:NAD(P)-dependent dehydrogenase (short-subunit alcohol dehydrogenase family)